MPHLPPEHVLRSFNVADAAPLAVEGGQGSTFRVADLALKPCDDPDESEWLGGVMESVREEGFRLARPVRSTSGRFVVDGWCASRWIDGETAIEGRWPEAIAACRAFHLALRHVEWSPVLKRNANPFRRADAAVWNDHPLDDVPTVPAVDRLRRVLRPVTLPPQLVHGDPSEGNLLFAPGRPPGVIDVAPYWHPTEYAVAVLVADGIAWSKAPIALLDEIAAMPQIEQMLARAVLFRLYVGALFGGGAAGAELRARAYGPVIDAVERWTVSR